MDQAFRVARFAFMSKPTNKTIPSFSMKIRLGEIPIHRFSMFPFQFSFDLRFTCCPLGSVKETAQRALSSF